MLPDGSGRHGGGRAKHRRSLRTSRDRANAHVFAVEELQPLGERPCLEHGGQLGSERVLTIRIELARGELGPSDQLAQPPEELGLERPHRQMPGVGGRVDPVAGKAAREEARERIAAQPVRDEAMRAVRHRDRQPGAAAGACPVEERSEDLGHGAECARCEVGRLERRQVRRGVLEDTSPAEVVQVVPSSRRVRPFGSEPRDRAVDRGLRDVAGTDTEPLRDAGPEAFEDHVGAAEQGSRKLKIRFQVDRDRLLAGVQRLVPGLGDTSHRVAVRLLEPHHPRAEPQQLAGRERARQVAGQVDDEHPCERLHPCRKYHYSAAELTDRSTNGAAAADKRRVILDAAVRVFATKGYHTSRVGDIAEEAGIAHGLLYHYFGSKEEVLQTVFRENWSQLVEALTRVEASEEPPIQQLGAIAKVLLRSWRDQPDLVRVMVREVARSPQLQEQVDEIRAVFLVIQRVIERGQADGSFRPELDARLASWIFYGGLEELLTGWVLGQLPDGDEEVARAEQTVVDLLCGGLTRVGAAASV